MKGKVVHVTSLAITISKLLDDQLRALANDGWETTAISSPDSINGTFNDRLYKHIPVHLPRTIKPKKDLLSYCSLCDIFKELKPDIVHTHSAKAALIALTASRRMSVPHTIHTVHGIYHLRTNNRIERKLAMWWEMKTIEKADMVLFVSKSDMEYLSRVTDSSNFHWLGNGIDTDHYQPISNIETKLQIRRKFGIPENALLLCTASRLTAQKGLYDMFKVFAQTSRKDNNIHLIVCGSAFPGDKNPITRKHAIKLGCPPDKIHFTGWLDDILHVLQITDVYITLSKGEGRSNSMMEAASAGCPFIVSNVSGMDAIVDEGLNGYRVNLNNPSRIKERILELAGDESLRRLMGKRSREIALRDFGNSIVNRRLIRYYDLLDV